MIRAAIRKGNHDNSLEANGAFPPGYTGEIAPVTWKGLQSTKDKPETAPSDLKLPAPTLPDDIDDAVESPYEPYNKTVIQACQPEYLLTNTVVNYVVFKLSEILGPLTCTRVSAEQPALF